MERRDFFKNSVLASGMLMVPSFLNDLAYLKPEHISGYKNVVVIQLSGGNDGLNTIVPYADDVYYQLRPSISKKKGQVLSISDKLALNGSLVEIRELYDQGAVAIINNVGYPNPNRSHFRSLDIWQSASSANQYLTTGWVGRYLDAHCHNPYQAIEVDSALSLALKGQELKGLAVANVGQLYNTTREQFFKKVVDGTHGDRLSDDNQGYLYKTMLETSASAKYIFETSKIYNTKVEYPNSRFGKNLKGIADFIVSGLKTRIYYSSLGGFDTHVNQVASQDKLLKVYSEGVGAFVKDLKKNDRFEDTLILTFSEFGRRVKQNASLGTDHGAANNVLVISGGLKKSGVYNEPPDLKHLDTNGDVSYSIDFRSVYATILKNWLDADDQKVLGNRFDQLDFV